MPTGTATTTAGSDVGTDGVPIGTLGIILHGIHLTASGMTHGTPVTMDGIPDITTPSTTIGAGAGDGLMTIITISGALHTATADTTAPGALAQPIMAEAAVDVA